ncbi:MAG TPA: transcriptional regulator GcvA [Candidatus Sulfotelmatobacter sp.]|nr:transcriptional regulator GcvA [Candidatus Sulfotelmatobacter sp.]
MQRERRTRAGSRESARADAKQGAAPDDRLPPLNALRTFEAAARHRNFSRAAEELHVTHGAVSHQMKALEGHLGVALFRRQGRETVLTEAGRQLLEHVQSALQRLKRGVAELRGQRRAEVLTVTTTPAFATRWLVPRLADFQARHPAIEVNLRASGTVFDFARDDIDLGVRFGPGHWPGLEAEKLLDEAIFPVASPTFRGGRLPAAPSELADVTLLRDPRQPWRDWFVSVGLDWPEPARGPLYDDAGLLLQAAAEGLGVALARGALVAGELEAGRLVRLFPDSARSSFAYYIVHPPGAAALAKVAAFRDWLRGQVAAPEAARHA